MPQMMPMLWLFIFFYSLIIFMILYIMINFFSLYMFPPSLTHKYMLKKWNWKW